MTSTMSLPLSNLVQNMIGNEAGHEATCLGLLLLILLRYSSQNPVFHGASILHERRPLLGEFLPTTRRNRGKLPHDERPEPRVVGYLLIPEGLLVNASMTLNQAITTAIRRKPATPRRRSRSRLSWPSLSSCDAPPAARQRSPGRPAIAIHRKASRLARSSGQARHALEPSTERLIKAHGQDHHQQQPSTRMISPANPVRMPLQIPYIQYHKHRDVIQFHDR